MTGQNSEHYQAFHPRKDAFPRLVATFLRDGRREPDLCQLRIEKADPLDEFGSEYTTVFYD
jgi:hypothetical protein